MFKTSQPPPVNADPLINNATAAENPTINVNNPIQDQQAVEVATKEDPLGATTNQIIQELDVKEFERNRDQVIKYEEFLSSYLASKFLCSIRLSQVYKELYTKLGSGEFNGVILPSTDEHHIKSLLYTADGECTCFRIAVDISKPLYTKYDIKAISVAVPSDAMGNRECSLEDLPPVIEIALIGNESDNLVYNHPLCEDVIHCGNCEELVTDINTLVNYVG